MRIVGGRFKGRVIEAPKGRSTRPTSDRARESLFNLIEHAPWAPPIEEARVMDLFAGSGAVGLEALSRGASFCLFVETEAAARGTIRDNIDYFQFFGVTRLHRRDATSLGDKPANLGAPFDIVFLDPPYNKGLGEKALARLIRGGWVHEHSIAILEEADEAEIYHEGWTKLDERLYGAARMHFLAPIPPASQA